MSDVIIDAVMEARVFQQFVDTYKPLVEEGRIHFNQDGIHAKVVDRAKVAMAETNLSSEAFESYGQGAVTVGLDFITLDERLSVANADDLLRISADMEAHRLNLSVRNIDQHVRLIEPDAIRQEPEIPDLDLPNTATITGADLDEVYKVLDMVSDHFILRAEPGEERVVFAAQGDIDESEVEFGYDELAGYTIPEATESMFSLDYLEDLRKPIPADSEVSLTFGQEFPMVMEWEATDGHQETMNIFAPRIQSD